MITVKDLINKLSKLPQNHSVVIETNDKIFLSEIDVNLEELNAPWSEPNRKSELVILRCKNGSK